MCKSLGISRVAYYYHSQRKDESKLEKRVVSLFRLSRNNYGSRKLKAAFKQERIILSRQKISRIMNKYGLVSNYQKARFKGRRTQTNNSLKRNVLNQEFKQEKPLRVVVTDLTYVRVRNKWHYVCLILDLYNREIIGHSCGPRKDVHLVLEAIHTIKTPLDQLTMFHTDRGKEFDNIALTSFLKAFKIKRSLSKKGYPYDNAVAETTYKAFKTEFVNQRKFTSFAQLRTELFDYVHWWNVYRLHGTLGYKSPVTYRLEQENML